MSRGRQGCGARCAGYTLLAARVDLRGDGELHRRFVDDRDESGDRPAESVERDASLLASELAVVLEDEVSQLPDELRGPGAVAHTFQQTLVEHAGRGRGTQARFRGDRKRVPQYLSEGPRDVPSNEAGTVKPFHSLERAPVTG
jgi:hypothetical protein